MIIQPASGPGVWERARCRICSKSAVTRSPTFAPFSSSTMLVDTVVPCSRLDTFAADSPARSRMPRTPVRMPTD